MSFPVTFKITDDSGFLAIVNADRFDSFIDEQWELPQLLNRFIEEMNKRHLIIWATGSENEWIVEFLDRSTNKNAFREFTKTITVTNGQLFLTNYEDLTMAAQFSDEKIPAKHNAELFIELANGEYEITVRQLSDPENYEDENRDPDFEIVIQKAINRKIQPVQGVFWFEE